MKTRRDYLFALLSLLLMGVLTMGSWVLIEKSTTLPVLSFAQVKAQYRSSDRWVLDRNGEILDQVRVEKSARRLAWAELENISPSLAGDVVRAEDHRFFQHAGVDFHALVAASWSIIADRIYFSHTGRRGASTITMQLAALLERDRSLRSGHRNIVSKFRQMRLAWSIEKLWSKPQILEAYLNLVSFRGELQGVQAASRVLFHRDAQGVNGDESAILVSLLRAPNASWDQVRARACRLTFDCKGVTQEIQNAHQHDQLANGNVRLAPQFARHLINKIPADHSYAIKASSTLASTVDANVQREAIRLATEQLTELAHQNVHDAAILVLENETGNVLAYVGNVASFSSANEVDGVQTRRQAGSTLKPFLYASAFDRKILTPHSLLADTPLEINTGRGLYRPQNYDQRFRGNVDVRTALASSMNVPAVRALKLLTPDAFVDQLNHLGFSELNSGADYGVSLALGTADITLWELTRAYRVFANHGLFSDLRESEQEPVPLATRVFSEKTSFQIGDILSDREARSVTFGLENPLATRFWTAVKTGTSKGMRDNWCIGFSSKYTVGVWVGNFNGEAMWDVSGISGAAPIWIGLMNYLHADDPSNAPAPPAEMTMAKVSDNQSLRAEPLRDRGFQKIILPSSGTVMAWDPDIPSTHQKMLFESTSHDPKFKWLLNGKVVGRADQPYLWTPLPGKHDLKIVGPSGKQEDEVNFTVR